MNIRGMALGALLGVSAWTPSRLGTAPVRAPRAVVSVANHNFLDIDVLVMVGETRQRLGTVVTAQTQNFDLPEQVVGTSQVRLVAKPVGSREAFVSDPLTVNDGERVSLDVANHLPQSAVRVERSSR